MSNGPQERGTVIFFNQKRGYGFFSLEHGGQLFCHFTKLLAIGRKTIRSGARVTFIRGRDRQGRPQVDSILEIDGIRTTQSGFERVGKKCVPVERAERPPHNGSSSLQWIPVKVRKLRKERTSYAESNDATVLIPWPVFRSARIDRLEPEERHEVRCRLEGDSLVATEVRRR